MTVDLTVSRSGSVGDRDVGGALKLWSEKKRKENPIVS